MRRINPIALAAALTLLVIAVAFGVLAARERELAERGAPTAFTPIAPAGPEPTAEPLAGPEPTAGPRLEIDPNAGARAHTTPAPREPGVAIPGWGSMTLPSGTTQAQTALRNPEENEGYYDLAFELRLITRDAQTGEEGYEVLFTTGLVPPGQYVSQVTLARELEPGEYAAIVHVQPYRIADGSPTNNADMETLLIVK